MPRALSVADGLPGPDSFARETTGLTDSPYLTTDGAKASARLTATTSGASPTPSTACFRYGVSAASPGALACRTSRAVACRSAGYTAVRMYFGRGM